MGEHVHNWELASSVPGSGCVFRCSCGAVVRVLRTSAGIRPEVLSAGGSTFTRRDGWQIVQRAITILGDP